MSRIKTAGSLLLAAGLLAGCAAPGHQAASSEPVAGKTLVVGKLLYDGRNTGEYGKGHTMNGHIEKGLRIKVVREGVPQYVSTGAHGLFVFEAEAGKKYTLQAVQVSHKATTGSANGGFASWLGEDFTVYQDGVTDIGLIHWKHNSRSDIFRRKPDSSVKTGFKAAFPSSPWQQQKWHQSARSTLNVRSNPHD